MIVIMSGWPAAQRSNTEAGRGAWRQRQNTPSPYGAASFDRLIHKGTRQAAPDVVFIGVHCLIAVLMLFDLTSSSHCPVCCGSAASAATRPVETATAWSRPAWRPAK